MTRRLESVDSIVKAVLMDEINELFAADVIVGYVVHNVETGEFMKREHATQEFLDAATKAYAAFLKERRP